MRREAYGVTDVTASEAALLAVEAARAAGEIIRSGISRPFDIDMKGKRDLVTSIDRESEALIIKMIRQRYPEDRIVAEETAPVAPGDGTGESAGRAWIIDPLDGTNNYAHGYPFFCVAIAIEEGGELVTGVVYDPLRDELFVAERGRGARLNGEPIHVSDTALLSDSIVATGFPYDRTEHSENNLANLNRFILSVRGIRRGGSAELDLVYVACGRLDGFWELNLKIWDVSAGGLIVKEAGGTVTNLSGRGWNHAIGNIVAGNGLIHAQMTDLVGAGGQP
jgi:myo-inositol-1(or 4)-monophosphatase